MYFIHLFISTQKGKYNVPKGKLELEVDEALPGGSGSEDDLAAEFGDFGRGEDQPLRSSTPPLRSSTPENLDRGGEMKEWKTKR